MKRLFLFTFSFFAISSFAGCPLDNGQGTNSDANNNTTALQNFKNTELCPCMVNANALSAHDFSPLGQKAIKSLNNATGNLSN